MGSRTPRGGCGGAAAPRALQPLAEAAHFRDEADFDRGSTSCLADEPRVAAAAALPGGGVKVPWKRFGGDGPSARPDSLVCRYGSERMLLLIGRSLPLRPKRRRDRVRRAPLRAEVMVDPAPANEMSASESLAA